MTSIFLAEHFERATKASPDAVSLEFFCDNNKDNKRNTADSVIQGLVFQLLDKRPELFNHILPTFAIQKTSLFTNSSFGSLWRVFEEMTCDPTLRTIYCVLDGLDECDKDSLEVLLRQFKALFSKNSSGTSSCRLNLIAVSRDLPEIIPELLSGFPRIRLDQDADDEVNKDIIRFIDAKLDYIFSVKEYPQSTRVKVKDIFMERAQGTFLWIGIAAKTLEGCNAIEFEEVLERLPSGLGKLYERMLLDIKVNHRQIAARILRWVVMAVRPLTLSELSAIIEPTVEPPSGFTREAVTKEQVSYCGYFLTVEEREVNLIHQSAKDYLLRGHYDSNTELRDFRMEEKAGNQEIARKCFQYLEDNLLASEKIDDPCRETLQFKDFPLLSYAIPYWPIHARLLPRSDDIFDLSRPFYRKDSRIRELWLETYWKLTNNHYDCRDSSKLLHIASRFGILPLAEKLLTRRSLMNLVKRSHSVNEVDTDGMIALHWAATGGHLAIVRLLLEKGADINAKDEFGNTALHRAVESKQEELVQLLLKKGADINAKHKYGHTALYKAIYFGHKEIVRLLLELEADVNTKDYRNKTALHIAAGEGGLAIAQLLLIKGADVNAKDDSDTTVLHNAAKSGNEGLIRLLLEKGMDINAKDDDGMTVLHLAAEHGHEGSVQLLLEKGANINAKNYYLEKTALHLAAMSGNEGPARLLLEKGADINAKDSNGMTVLHLAAKHGHEGSVRLLLEKGADVSAKYKDGRTALHGAASSGDKGPVRLLLEKGADVSAKDRNGWTALHVAANSGYTGLIQLLLDMRADVNAKGNSGITALHEAATRGHEGSVRLLLEKGADLNAKDKYGMTALNLADIFKHEVIAQLLLSIGGVK